MTELKSRESAVLSSLASVSAPLAREILSVMSSGSGGLEEIRLRADGMSSVRVSGRDYALLRTVCRGEIEEILCTVSGSSLYAHRESIGDGYIAFSDGVRVGVAGKASYEGGKCIGVGEVTSLVFRIPSGECLFADELYGKWCRSGEGGMLIISPPGGGKTTALRSLARYIGKNRRTVIVDERCEFDPESYRGVFVDILRGYKRASGIEIAVRTMSAEVIICDEIFTNADSDALIGALGAGVTVIATAHGNDLSGVRKRGCIASLLDVGMFSSLVTVTRRLGIFSYTYEEIK